MTTADITGPAATARGLRHSFAIVAVAATVPVTMIQKWMGHSDTSTTAIYLDASGPEERHIALRIWRGEFFFTWQNRVRSPTPPTGLLGTGANPHMACTPKARQSKSETVAVR